MLIAPVAAVLSDLGSATFDDTVAAVGAANMVGSGLDWARAFARQRVAELVGRKWIGGETVEDPDAEEATTESTKNMLRTKIEQAIKDKLSQDAFAAELARSVFSRHRAERIAQYETTNIFHQATLQAFKQSDKVQQVRWVTMGDDRVETVCQQNADAGPIAVGGAFPSGDHSPPAHPACRCWIEPVS
jgi:SPP1 gp7 family putative phage head morphogenesis protein